MKSKEVGELSCHLLQRKMAAADDLEVVLERQDSQFLEGDAVKIADGSC